METKKCTKCLKEKPLESFYRDARASLGGKSKGRMGRCKECSDAKKAEWVLDNRDKWQQRNASYYQANKREHQLYKLCKTYGVAREWYDETLQAQQNRCAICGTTDPGRGDSRREMFAVDHDHSSGKVRGLLCISCNMALGGFQDDALLLHKAILYLEEFKDENRAAISQTGLDHPQCSPSNRNGS